MKYLFIILISFGTHDLLAQNNCGLIGKTRNKNFTEGTAYGKMVSSKDSYSVMYEKIINTKDTANYPQYVISMICAAKHLLPDSVLARTGPIEITFSDQSTIKWKGATCSNIPTLMAWNFELRLTEKQFEILTEKELETIKVFQKVETSLPKINQKRLKNIANCLKIK